MQDGRMAHHLQPDEPRHVSDVAVSLIRTWVPIAAGSVLAWIAASQHIAIPAGASAAVGAFLAAALAAGYYALARVLEQARGESFVARSLRALGRYMLGGLIAKPTYLDAADYERLRARLRV